MIKEYVQKLDINGWLIISLLIIVVAMIVFWPSKPPEDKTKRIYWEAIEKLHEQNRIKDATVNAVIKRSNYVGR